MSWGAGLRRLLRQRPEAWFIPAAALLLVTSFTPVGEPDIGPAALRHLALVTPDRILPFTLAAAVVCGAIGWVTARRRGWLGPWRALLVSASIAVGAVGAFEFPLQVLRLAVGGSATPGPTLGGWLTLGTWVLVGLTPVGFWRWTRKTAVLLGGIAAGFLLWGVVGFPQVTSTALDTILLGYLFNVPLKLATFAVFTLLFWEGVGEAGPTPRPQPLAGRPDPALPPSESARPGDR